MQCVSTESLFDHGDGMRYRAFPGSDLVVSEIGFGLWTLSTGWWGEKSDEDALAMLRAAYDEHGITFFDAADAYGNRRCERSRVKGKSGRGGRRLGRRSGGCTRPSS